MEPWPTRSRTCSTCSASSPSSRCSTRATRSRSACAPTRARRTASRRIATDLGQLTVKELQKIEGVGKSTAAKIRELLETGKVDKLEELRAKHPASVVALMRIQGLGPKAVKRLRAELGVQSLDDLRKALAEHKLRALKGFGEKSEEKLAQVARAPRRAGRARAHAHLGRAAAGRAHRRAPARGARRDARLVLRLAAALLARPSATSTSSSPRPTPAPVMEALVAMNVVDRVLGRGDTKTSVVTRRGTQIDLRVVAAHQLGAALLYFTGSKGHNIKLRTRALARGWTLNEYALSEIEGGKVIASETEEQIYAALGLPFIPPVLREDCGEIEAAETRRRCRGRSARSSATSTCTRRCRATGARRSRRSSPRRSARGYRVLAITDHAEGTLSGVGREALLEQRAQIAALQTQLGDSLTLLHGVELNIGPNGELDYDLEFRAPLRLVPRLGARPLRARSRRADHAHRDRHAGPDGAHDRPPLGAHDRRPPAHRPRPRRDLRRRRGDGHRARDQRRPAAPRHVGRGAAPRARARRRPSC